jgi:hypothetical protein
MGYKKKKSPYFIVEIDGHVAGDHIAIEQNYRTDSIDTPRKAYLYPGGSQKIGVGFVVDKALRFLSAELAIEYVNRNETYRSILPFVKIERFSEKDQRRIGFKPRSLQRKS